MSARFGSRGEGEDRELFARRARVLSVPEVPALAAILAAADASGERRAGSVDGARAWGAAVAVAACFAALFLPRGELIDREVGVVSNDADRPGLSVARAGGEMCVASPDEDLRLAACVTPDEPRASRMSRESRVSRESLSTAALSSDPGEQALVCVNETSCRLRGP